MTYWFKVFTNQGLGLYYFDVQTIMECIIFSVPSYICDDFNSLMFSSLVISSLIPVSALINAEIFCFRYLYPLNYYNIKKIRPSSICSNLNMSGSIGLSYSKEKPFASISNNTPTFLGHQGRDY